MDPLQIAMAVMWTIREIEQLARTGEAISVEEEMAIAQKNLDKVKLIKAKAEEEMQTYGKD